LLSLLSPPAAFAAVERLALLPATGANVEVASLAAATDVLRSQVERTGRYVVVMATLPEGAGVREPTPSEAVATARAMGAPLAATLRISRLGEVGIARLAVYRDSAGDAPVHLDEIPMKGIDDLEPALQRLAAGLAQGAPARALAEIDTVTEREADPRLYKQQASSRSFGVRLSGTMILDPADGRARAAQLSGLGLAWLYDAHSFFAESMLDVQWSQMLDASYHGSRDWLIDVGLGAYYPFLRGDVSPYMGAAVLYLSSHTGSAEGGSGIAVRPAAGLLVGRLSDVHFRFDVGWQVSTFQERDVGGGSHRSQGPTLSVAVLK
jgi:hypothetical protein